jgi:hypothetical protein
MLTCRSSTPDQPRYPALPRRQGRTGGCSLRGSSVRPFGCPVIAVENSPYSRRSHAEVPRERRLTEPCPEPTMHRSRHVGRDFRGVMSRTLWCDVRTTPLGYRIPHVVATCTKPQMLDANTRRVVTTVEDLQSRRNGTDFKLPRESVSVPTTQSAITVLSRTGPFQAAGISPTNAGVERLGCH